MPKKRQYMQKFRALPPQKKRRDLTVALRWLLRIIGRDGQTPTK